MTLLIAGLIVAVGGCSSGPSEVDGVPDPAAQRGVVDRYLDALQHRDRDAMAREIKNDRNGAAGLEADLGWYGGLRYSPAAVTITNDVVAFASVKVADAVTASGRHLDYVFVLEWHDGRWAVAMPPRGNPPKAAPESG